MNYKIGDLVKIKKSIIVATTTYIYSEFVVNKRNKECLEEEKLSLKDIMSPLENDIFLVLDKNVQHTFTKKLKLKVLYDNKIYYSVPEHFTKIL